MLFGLLALRIGIPCLCTWAFSSILRRVAHQHAS
jgi:hypothetical protein